MKNDRVDFTIPGVVETKSGWVGVEDVHLRVISEGDGLLLAVTLPEEKILLSLDIINEKAGELCGRTGD